MIDGFVSKINEERNLALYWIKVQIFLSLKEVDKELEENILRIVDEKMKNIINIVKRLKQ